MFSIKNKIYYRVLLAINYNNVTINCHIFLKTEYTVNEFKIREENYMNQMNNMDMGKLMEMLSKMDKKQLEQGLAKVSQVLSSEDKSKIFNEINKKG